MKIFKIKIKINTKTYLNFERKKNLKKNYMYFSSYIRKRKGKESKLCM